MMTSESAFSNAGRTKLALVSHGVSLPEGLPESSRWLAQVNGVETVIDMRLPTGQFCTVPVGQPYTEKSVYSLRFSDGKPQLCCGDEVSDVSLIEVPAFYRKKTRNGSRMGSFASLHDRLLILQPWQGCGFFAGEGFACHYCQFDSMVNDDSPPLRDPLELVEVVLEVLKERTIDTVYLYNGHSPGDDVGLKQLVPVIALLRRHLGTRQIALETIAPADVGVIDSLYAAGLDVFVCNLELADEERFSTLCPGKHALGGQQAVIRALQHATQVFRRGAVVSNLIVGLEPIESSVRGMKLLVDMGVVPMVSGFRPLPDTPLKDHPLPSFDEIEQVLLAQYELLESTQIPTHRLRGMGRVLTPMESRVLDGSETALEQQWSEHSWVQRSHVWLDHFRRAIRMRKYDDDAQNIDRRAFSVALADMALPYVAMLVLALATIIACSMDAPAGLSESGWRAIIVFVLCLVLWVTQLLPLSITSLLGMALLPMLGVLSATHVFALFGNPAVFFILGAFMLTAGVMRSGLSTQVALAVMARTCSNSRHLLLAMLGLPALMACMMPEHAVSALFLPLAMELVAVLGLRRHHPYAQAIFFALAWGAIIGGVMTLLGGARGPLALALSSELTGKTFSFLQWTLAAFPVVIAELLLAAWLLLRMVGKVELNMDKVSANIREKQLQTGAMGLRSWAMAVLVIITVISWMVAGHASMLASIALVSVVVMFALRLVDWADIERHVNWGVILMYGGAIAIGKSLSDTGAALWLAESLIPGDLLGLGLIALLILVTLLFTEGMSNAAAVAVVLPIAIPIGIHAGFNPVPVALLIGIMAGFAFMLPMSTPPNAMIFGSGYVTAGTMLRYGMVLSISSFVLMMAAVKWWWPLIGMSMGVG